jgi:outer membrane protein assembly factor BamB
MSRMSQRMLEGWTLVQRHCPRCTTALQRNPLGELSCAACEATVVEEQRQPSPPARAPAHAPAPPASARFLPLALLPLLAAAQPQANAFAQSGFGPTKSNLVLNAVGPATLPSVAWRTAPGAVAGPFASAMALDAAGRLFVGSYNGSASALYAVDTRAAGGLAWTLPVAGNVGGAPAILSDGSVLVATDASKLLRVSPTGAAIWSIASPTASSLIAPAVGADGSVYFGGLNGLLQKFASTGAAATGSPVWSRSIANLAGSPALSPDGSAIYICASGTGTTPPSILHKVSAANGTTLWTSSISTTDVDAYVTATPSANGSVVFFVSNAHLHAVLAATGTQLFPNTAFGIGGHAVGIHGKNSMAPALLPNGNVLLGDTAGISCHSASTGAKVWTFSTTSATIAGGEVSAQPIVDANGNAYFGDATGKVFSLSSAGALRWSLQLPNASKIWASGVLAGDGTLFFATSNPAAIFALRASPSASPSIGAAPSPSPSLSPAGNGPSPSSTPSSSLGAAPSTSASTSPVSSPIGLSSGAGALAAGGGGGGGSIAVLAAAVAGAIAVVLLVCFCAALHVGGILSVPCFILCCPAGRRQSLLSKKASTYETVELTTIAQPALSIRVQRTPARA